MSGLSLYFHASLYVFKVRAVTAITALFDEKVNNPAARCWWEPQQEIFVLECPQMHGAFCDNALGEIIASYIATELEAAEREERDPDIVRYPRSKFDQLDSATTEEQDQEEANLQPPSPPVRPITTHSIVTGEGEGKQAKLFHMHQLPEDFLRRALSPFTDRDARLFANGFTCRAVRWDGQKGFVFNGRDGTNSPVATTGGGEFLTALIFPALEDLRDRSESDDEMPLPVNQWEHVDGAPRVEDWVRGVGQMRQILPGSEVEADNQFEIARKPVAGRLIELAGDGSDQGDLDAGDEVGLMQSVSFGDMLSGPTIADLSDGNDSDSDEDVSRSAKVPADRQSRATPAKRADNRGWSTVDLPVPQSKAVLRSNTNAPPAPAPRSAPQYPSQEAAFPDWGSKWSKVDEVGLLAPAAATAEWDLRTHVSRPANRRMKAIVPRTTTQGSGTSTATSQEAQDQVIDRLQSLSPNFARTMNTMNQKAGRKGKGKGSSKPTGNKFKAELPLPDPVPPPKPKKVTPQPSQKQVVSAGQAAAATNKPDDAFSKLLAEVLEKQRQYAEEEDDEDDDEENATPKFEMKLVAQVGMILLRSDDKDFGSQKTVSPGEFQERLNAMSNEVKTSFNPRFTTADSDAVYLNDIFKSKMTEEEAFYEIYIQDINGWHLKVIVPAANKGDFTIKAHDREIGQACLHYPVRVWDARMVLVDPGLPHLTQSRDAIAEFVSSMAASAAEAPSFYASIPPAQFIVERVLAHRVFSHDLNGMIYRLVETQDLEMSRQSHRRHYNFVARAAETKEEMAARHRLWWEVKLETGDLHMAQDMQSRVDGLVRGMDGVGLANVGPWDVGSKAGKEEREESVAETVRVMTGNIEW